MIHFTQRTGWYGTILARDVAENGDIIALVWYQYPTGGCYTRGFVLNPDQVDECNNFLVDEDSWFGEVVDDTPTEEAMKCFLECYNEDRR